MARNDSGSGAFASLLRDRDLAERINEALRADSRVDAGEVDVRVEQGVVYLMGMVDSAAERRAAQEDAEAAAGAGRVVDMLTLRNFIERTDEELSAAVRQAVVRDISVSAPGVAVDARDGVVTLSGPVDSYAQKSAVENIAWWTPGVTDVVSHLQVNGIAEPPDEPDY